jgi:hypothetical protein
MKMLLGMWPIIHQHLASHGLVDGGHVHVVRAAGCWWSTVGGGCEVDKY